jgi:CheY-like chemotaxis protein
MESPNSGQLRALVVDDPRDPTIVLGKLLEKLGCDVTTCQVASECIDHAHRTHPHLILLDIAMPRRNGFTLADELLNANLQQFYLVALRACLEIAILRVIDEKGTAPSPYCVLPTRTEPHPWTGESIPAI